MAKNSKRPIHNNWQTNTKLFSEVLAAHNTRQANIGLLLGKTSSVIDIDSDSHDGVAVTQQLADGYLGYYKRGHDSAHYLFLCEEGGKTVQLADPDGSVIVEPRGDGGQTMAPPSTHPDGNQLSFSKWNEDAP